MHKQPQILSNRIWAQLDCGLIVPCGTQSLSEIYRTKSFLEIKQMAALVSDLFDTLGISLSPQSSIAKLIKKASELSDAWLTNQIDSLPDGIVYEALTIFRIAESILALDGEPNIMNHMRKLSRGHLNLLERTNSEAKNFLWEIELFALLKNAGFNPIFSEPDIQVTVDDQKVGFACKKVYSENNFSNLISKGIHQIERCNVIGIIAICLDDTRPPAHKVLRALSQQDARNILRDYNCAFLKRHEHLLLKYLQTERMASCLVITNTAAIIKSTALNAGECTGWFLPSLEENKKRIIEKVYSRFL